MNPKEDKFDALATQILNELGGLSNIDNVMHCVTRLRFYLKDQAVPNKSKIESLEGVIGVVEANDQFQIIIGPEVEDVYKAVVSQMNGFEETVLEEKGDPVGMLDKIKSAGNQVLGIITGSMMPVISILAASGVIKSILTVLSVTTDVISTESGIYLIINAMADAVFYFLPIMIGINAARRLKGNIMMTAVVAGVMVHPSVVKAASEGMNILEIGSLTFPFVSYSYSVFPIILAAWFIKVLEGRFKKFVPSVLESIMVPILTIGSVAGISLLITGPIIMKLSLGLASGLSFLLNVNAPLFSALIAGFYQVLVIFGLHWGIIPLYVNDFALYGHSQLSAVVSVLAVGQGGAALAVAMKTKRKKTKEIGYAGAVSAFAGITEPAMFGVNLRFKKPFIFASIASAVGGFVMGLFNVTMWNIMGSIIGLPSFIDPDKGMTSNFYYAVFATAITLILSFVLTYIWGYNDQMDMDEALDSPEKP